MPLFTGISRFVNPEGLINQVNDAMPGGTQNSVAGIQIARDPGMLGSYYYLTGLEAAQRYTNLYEGLYQYVKLDSASSTPAVGQAAFWSATVNQLTGLTSYTVTLAETTTDEALFAGVFLNAITPGNYGWIQVGGVATVQYVSSLTGAASIGAAVAVDFTGTTSKFDLPVQTVTAQPVNVMKQISAVAITLPVNNTTGQVLLKGGTLGGGFSY